MTGIVRKMDMEKSDNILSVIAENESTFEAVSHAAYEKYPGIEINYREDIARTDTRYITESLAAVKSFGLEGAALCWNVMLAPEAHIDAIVRMENEPCAKGI